MGVAVWIGAWGIVAASMLSASTASASPPPAPMVEAAMVEDRGEPAESFRSQSLSLSDVLRHAATHNPDVSVAEVDVAITEARVLGALGAYDLTLTAHLDGEVSEFPQRGSQLSVALGSRTVGGGLGMQRRLETGGSVALTFDSYRSRADQPTNLLDPTQGQSRLTAYSVVPSLTVTHDVLRGAGLKMGRAPIEKARIASSIAEADQQAVTQRIALEIIVAYWDLLYAHRDLVNKRGSVVLAQEQFDATRALHKSGRRSNLDTKVAQQGLVAREADVLAAEQAVLQASLRLRALMGDELDRVDRLGVLPTTDPVVEIRVVMMEDEVAAALRHHPEIRRAELAQSSAAIDERVAANGRRPKVEVSGRFSPQGRSIDTLPDPNTGAPGARATWGGAFSNMFNDDVGADGVLADWTLSGTVTVSWDVRNRSAKAAHQEAQLSIQRGEVELAQVRRRVAAQVVEAASGLRTAAKRIDVAELSHELALDNLQAERARFKVGRATNHDVLLRLDEVDRAAAQALGARIEYLKSLARLQALNGELLGAYGLQG